MAIGFHPDDDWTDWEDDGPLGISGSMKEDLRNEQRLEEKSCSPFAHRKEDDEDPYPEE